MPEIGKPLAAMVVSIGDPENEEEEDADENWPSEKADARRAAPNQEEDEEEEGFEEFEEFEELETEEEEEVADEVAGWV